MVVIIFQKYMLTLMTLYQNIVNALLFAEQQTVPRIPHSALKAYWSDELDSLKKKVFWQKIWESADCHKDLLLQIKTKAKLNFKLAVKQAVVSCENSHSDDMYQHFLNKTCLISGSRKTLSLEKGYGTTLSEW